MASKTVCDAVNDQALLPDAVGCNVAKAALDRVKSNGIFQTDDKFLPNAFKSELPIIWRKKSVKSASGIWHLPEQSLNNAQDISVKLISRKNSEISYALNLIRQHLNITESLCIVQ